MNPSTNIIIVFFIAAGLISVTSFVYSYVLTQPGEIFGRLYGVLDRLFKTNERATIGKGPHPLFRMIMYCEKCVAGQLGTWIYLIYAWPWYRELQFILIIPHILFIGLCIFLTLIIKSLYINHIE